MLGGLMGVARDLMDEGAHGAFEQACEAFLGEAVRADTDVAVKLWCALANIRWVHPDHGEVTYSFRAAGDLVAALRRSGDYMDWYCSGDEAVVDPQVEAAMVQRGWKWLHYESQDK